MKKSGMNKNKMKKKKAIKRRVVCLGGMLLMLAIGMAVFWSSKYNSRQIQQGIAEKIIRFHVIANSDSEEDQQLKLKVKEQVLKEMEPIFEQVDSVEEAREQLQIHRMELVETAQDVLEKEGCCDTVQAQLTNCYFPIKQYGDLVFPNGEYETFRMVIGNGEGKNWWCVMFPKLCFVDSLYCVVPDESKEELQEELSDEEYESILNGEKKVKIKFKLLEWLGF